MFDYFFQNFVYIEFIKVESEILNFLNLSCPSYCKVNAIVYCYHFFKNISKPKSSRVMHSMPFG